MNMRATLDPYTRCGNWAPLVDKFIGNAYDTVRYVALNLKPIEYVAWNMAAVNAVAAGMQTGRLIPGMTGEATSTVLIKLPDDVPALAVTASSVLICPTNGDIYGTDSGYFTAAIVAGYLRITLKGNAPVELEMAPVRWFLQFGVK